MAETESLIRNISDTALWAAEYRARESERPDALFRDPFARRLAGSRGASIADNVPRSARHDWAWVARTYLYDQYLSEAIADGVDTVINLAAGLDARPYRMQLPPALKWFEIDLPDLLRYKEEMLKDERPVCRLERRPLDLAHVAERQAVLREIGQHSERAAVVTEGLLIYLSPDEVAGLAQDLHAVPAIERWFLEIASPGLLKMMKKQFSDQLQPARASFRFAPEEGPAFFQPYGWRAVAVRSLLKTAAHLGRLSLFMRLMSFLPEPKARQGSRPWSAVCRFDGCAPHS